MNAVQLHLILITLEGHEVPTDPRLQSLSPLLQRLIEDSSPQSPIPLPFLPSPVLTLIVEYYEHHNYTNPLPIPKPLASDRIEEVVRDPWDAQFITGVSEEVLVDMATPLYTLGLLGLFDLCCAKIATLFKGKSVKELKRKYDITKDLTLEMEEKIVRENPWITSDSSTFEVPTKHEERQ